MTYVITEPCIDLKDATCVDVCPVDCIHTTDDDKQFYIDPAICIDCEACVFVCPVDAIFYEEDVPGKWSSFSEINRSYFAAKTDEERRTFRTRTARAPRETKGSAAGRARRVSLAACPDRR